MESDFFAHRWKASNLVKYDFSKGKNPSQNTTLSLLGLLGPEPYPDEILPRSWDYIHRLYPAPELGVMSGAGIKFDQVISKKHYSNVSVTGGFFAGYWGGALKFNIKGIQMNIGSYGIEGSAAYQVLGQRLNMANLAFSF